MEFIGLGGANHPFLTVSGENQHHPLTQADLRRSVVGQPDHATPILDEKPEPGQEFISQRSPFIHGLRRTDRNHGGEHILLPSLQGHQVQRPVDVIERKGVDPEVLFEMAEEGINHFGTGGAQQ